MDTVKLSVRGRLLGVYGRSLQWQRFSDGDVYAPLHFPVT